MTCPRCFSDLDAAGATCPECGLSLYRNVSGVVKTSVVMISTGDDNNFYSSVQEVPEALRRRLLESTSSRNAGTIVIADRAGKEQLTQVMARRLEGSIESATRALSAAASPQPGAPASLPGRQQPASIRRISWLAWVGFLTVLALAAFFSLFFGLRW